MILDLRRMSYKQKKVMHWWSERSADRYKDAIICDGAVRSGKTVCTGLSFFIWAMERYRDRNFALCGRTLEGVRRNLVRELVPTLEAYGIRCREEVSRNRLIVTRGGRRNTFYLFGGKDEASASLIQGITLAGVLLDEVALMPRSFVEQAMARCSVPGSKIWFSCNPEGPNHWFYKEWIQRAKEKNALYIRFTMEDNPGLTENVRERFRRLFRGTFYRRFILGEWVAAQGTVYDFFTPAWAKPVPPPPFGRWRISCDYGTANPTSFGLWGEKEGVWYRVAEYYYDSRKEGVQKTDREYADDLARLAGGRPVEYVIADPSAASFIETLRRDGWRVRRADNEVLKGIRVTGRLLKEGRLVICDTCKAALEEFALYRWQDRGDGKDTVCKEHDHAMDEIRYFAMSLTGEEDGPFAALSVVRR